MPTIGGQHIVTSYDQELKKLEEAMARMCGLAEAQMTSAIQALAERDDALARQVIATDCQVDECQLFIDEQTVRLLALRAPVADDLRMVISRLKAAGDIERIADHAAGIAKRTLVLDQAPAVRPVGALARLGRQAQELLSESLEAFLFHDAERALVLRARDQEVDRLYSSVFREILTYMMEDQRTITVCSHLLFIAKNIERIGDHATNIAEMTYFLVKGRTLKDQRFKQDTSTLVGAEG